MSDRSASEGRIRVYLTALNDRDADAAAACVSEDFVNEHTSSLGETVTGRAAYRRRLERFFREFSALRYDIEELIVDGGRIALAYRLSGCWQGADGAIQPGRPFSLRGMFRFRVEAGLIVHRVDYWDSAEFSRQTAAQDNGR